MARPIINEHTQNPPASTSWRRSWKCRSSIANALQARVNAALIGLIGGKKAPGRAALGPSAQGKDKDRANETIETRNAFPRAAHA
jgi:hypothetical protein